jgi:hypothetical protein
MQAPSSPTQLAAVADVFARLQHRRVVVPELLNALGSQVCVSGGCSFQQQQQQQQLAESSKKSNLANKVSL